MTDKSLLLAGLVGLISTISLVVALNNPFAGLILASAGIVLGVGFGAVLKANTELGEDIGVGSLSESDEMEAVKWAVLAVGGFVLLILDQLFFIAGVVLILYGVFGYLTTKGNQRINVMLQRFGVALLFFLAWSFSGLLVLPIAALLAKFTWVFVPDQKKQKLPSIGDNT